MIKKPGLKAFSTRKLARISHIQEQIKPVKKNFSRKTCSSYRRVSELVKKQLVKGKLLVCTIDIDVYMSMVCTGLYDP